MFKLFEKTPKSAILLMSSFFTILVGVFGCMTGVSFSMVMLYFIPITIVVWYVNLQSGVMFSFFCLASIICTEFFYDNSDLSNYIFFVNMIKRLLIFLIFAIVVYTLKKNLELTAKNKNIIQKSHAIISTSQRMTGVIIESIIKHNSELLSWINKQKENGQHVPEIIVNTHRNIGESLRALSEASFCETVDNEDLSVDDFIILLQKKLKMTSKKIFSKSNK